MAKKDIKEILENAKRITVEASQAIVDTATVVVDKTQTAIVETTTRIRDERQEKKDAEAQARRLEIEAVLSGLQGTYAPTMLNALCESPVALTKPNIQRMRELFPIPVEQRIIKAEEQENVIRDFLCSHFEEITSAREVFALPSGETILESLMEECVE